jgi:WD40 repeat protein
LEQREALDLVGTRTGISAAARARTIAALATPDGRPVAVTGSWDGTVRVWDLDAGVPVGEPLTGHTRGVRAMAALVLPDGRPVAVTGSWDGTVRVWSLAADPAAAALIPVPGPVAALTAVCSNDRAWIVVAGAGHGCIEITRYVNDIT